jgi:hypothetical protein
MGGSGGATSATTGGAGGKTTTGTTGSGGADGGLMVCSVASWGDSQDQAALGVLVDAAGYLVLTGSFAGQVDFNKELDVGTTFVAVLTTPTMALWSTSMPVTLLASAVDAQGRILIAGTYGSAADAGTVDFGDAGADGGDGGSSDGGSGGCGPLDPTKHSFVAAFDQGTGDCKFAQSFAASPTRASLAVDPAGDIFFAGGVAGVADFGGASPPTTNGEDIFVVKLDPSGNWQWQRDMGSAGNDEATGVAYDANGHVVVTGTIAGPVNFGLSGMGPIVSVSKADVFVLSLDGTNDGQSVWATSFPGAATDTGASAGVVAVSSGLVVAGSFGKSVTVGTKTLTSTNGAGFAAWLDLTGAPTWEVAITGGTATTTLASLAVDTSGDTAYVGAYGPDILVAELGPTGALTAQHIITGMQGSARRGNAVAFDGTKIAVVGAFAGTLDLGGGQTRASAGGLDAFLLELCF